MITSFKAQTRLHKVYHIRIKGNTDLREGYIGITRRSLPYRLGQHFNSKRPVGTILRNLGREAVEIVEVTRGYKEYALNVEYILRPSMNEGWNVRAGGDAFTVVCPQCGRYLPKRKTGTICADCQQTQFSKGHIPHNAGMGERYTLISPEGTLYNPEVFTRFCKENNLTPQNLRKVAKGTRKNHKGWLCTYRV